MIMRHREARGPLFAELMQYSEKETGLGSGTKFHVSIVKNALELAKKESRILYKPGAAYENVSASAICFMLGESWNMADKFGTKERNRFLCRMVDAVRKQEAIYGSSAGSDTHHVPASVGLIMHGAEINFYFACSIYERNARTVRVCSYKNVKLARRGRFSDVTSVTETAVIDAVALMLNQLDFVRDRLRNISTDRLQFGVFDKIVGEHASKVLQETLYAYHARVSTSAAAICVRLSNAKVIASSTFTMIPTKIPTGVAPVSA
ncbi:hypothetical protein THASP1DRAFT_32137 [Thamnocephalis sphaerospora]|uniref:Uncharacterized protein n=1 Tax=Thamnocephalis sphaerospora TaxID=78915 RepID=A0A4P9XJS3_9FUNG|nr:hypothetical protein THASP1DRAFT_32137 [Thamnocephalis sphaerospora]|eukprot:RKP06033.1 hypothetical protein THASP1DRAFT_32137 [Thamnocephalis sphaerospora]